MIDTEINISFISMVMVNNSESPDDILYAAHSVVWSPDRLQILESHEMFTLIV
jgi:hypothetical protein